MSYSYDYWGWYDGVVADGSPRSTDVVPSNTSLTTVAGQPRSNWTGREWIELPYAVAEDDRVRERLVAAKKIAIAKLDAEFNAKIADKFDDETGAVITMLPVLFDLWRSIINSARLPNAGWQWLLDHRAVYAQAKSDIRAANNLRQVDAVFPINWP